MKKWSLFLFCSCAIAIASFFLYKKQPLFTDITAFGYEQYQDILIHNAVVKKATGNHDCQSRYALIQHVLDRYERPFTLLDLGASQGYYSFRTAHDYEACCVMIEGNNPHYPMIGTQLLELCKLNNDPHIIFLNKPLILEDLQRLGECESFGTVLALNIIHWFGPHWKEMTDAILALGDNIIIETPPQETCVSAEQNALRKEIEDYLLSLHPHILGTVPRHTSNTEATLYLFEQEKTTLRRKTWLAPTNSFPHQIQSNFKTQMITKFPPHAHEKEVYPWKQGINLLTFKMYQGVYPTKEMIKSALKRLQDRNHTDWTINNMILQGKNIALIDQHDPVHGLEGGRYFSKRSLHAHFEIIDLDDPKKVEDYFWHRLTQIR